MNLMPSLSGFVYIAAVMMALFGSYILAEEVISEKISITQQKVIRYLIFPLFTILILSYPFQYSEGVILDQRGAIIAIATLFAGEKIGLITAMIGALWRIHLGGVGFPAGVIGMLMDFLGVLWVIRSLGRQNLNFSESLKLSTLLRVGIIVGITEALSLLFIPPPSNGLRIFSHAGIALFIIQLLSTLLFGGLMAIREREKKAIHDYLQTQSELESSRNLLETLVSHIPGNLYTLVQYPNGSLQFEYVSSGCQELLELEPQKILEDAQVCFDLIHPDDRPRYDAAFLKSLQTLESFLFQWRLVTPSGKIKWVQGSSRPQRRSPGETVWHGVLLDITERKQAEIALQESEERYRHITATVPGVLYEYGVYPDGSIQFFYLSPRCREILEIEPSAIVQNFHLFSEMIYPDDLPIIETISRQANRKKSLCIAEIRIFTPSGRLKWLQFSSLPGKQLLSHGVTFWSGFMLDITEQKQTQLRLASQETFLRSIYEGVEIGIFVVEAIPSGDFHLVSINPACQRNIGVPQERLIGKPLSELPLPDMDRAREHYRQCIESGKPLIYEETVQLKGQTTSWYTTLTPLEDEHNRYTRLIGTSINITDLKQVESDLKGLQERLALVLRGSDDGWWDWDLRHNTFFYSPRWWEMLGYTPDELPLNPHLWQELIHPDEQEWVNHTLSQALEGNGESYQMEFRLLHQQGHYVPVRSRGYIQRDERGFPQRVSGADTDLTSWKQKELQLQNALDALHRLNQELELRVEERARALIEKEQRYRALMEGASDAIILTDLEGKILEANQKAIKILGYSEQELLSMHLSQCYPPDESEWENPFFCDIAQQKTILCKNGERLTTEITRSVISWGEEQIVLTIYRDVTERQQIENALRKSQETLRLITDSLPLCISYIDQNQYYLFVNYTYQVWFNRSPEEIIGKQVRDLLDEEAYQVFADHFQQVLLGETVSYENKIPMDQEKFRHVYATLIPDRNGHGEIIGCFVMTVNITELKTAELALRESEQRFRYLADHAPVLIWMAGTDKLCSYFNQPWLEFTGRTVEQEWGAGWSEGVHPDDFSYCIETYNHAFDNRESFEMVYRLRRFDGEYRWILDHGIPRYSSDGQFLGYIGSCLDISDRKKVEETILLSEERFRRYFEQSLIGMAITSPEKGWVDVNERLCEILGYSYQELTQMTWAEITYPDDLELDVTNFNQVLAGIIDGYSMDKRFIRKNGEVIDASISVRCLRQNDGTVDFFVAMVQDISDRKQAEIKLKETNEKLALSNAELAHATRLKDEFLANMSHELRTPLNAILGMCEGLQDEVFGMLNERQKNSLKTIERSGNHLLELINDILDLAKVESGKLHLQPTSVAINYLCESSLTFIRQECVKKGIQLNLEIPSGLSEIVIDERRIRQALINLLNNAVKFTQEGGRIKLIVEVETWTYSEFILFSVIDSGIGIAPEDIKKLFQPFIQIDSSLSRQHGGTGLGLALVQRLVDLHGGTVSVKSEVGRGSCFTIRLPLFTPSQEMGNQVKTEESEIWGSGVGESGVGESGVGEQEVLSPGSSILLAEDNDVNIATISSYLRAQNYRVILANNGEDAVTLTKSQNPDLILMDISMPKMDGLEAMRLIRSEPKFVNIPIIALTALAMPSDREKCLAAGATDYITKPVLLKSLLARIEELLKINK